MANFLNFMQNSCARCQYFAHHPFCVVFQENSECDGVVRQCVPPSKSLTSIWAIHV